MGNFFTNGPAAPVIQQVTFQQNNGQTVMTPQERIANTNQILTTLINSELLPNILTTDQLTIICHHWLRQTASNSNTSKIHNDAIKLIVDHSRFEILECELLKKIIEEEQITSAIQWFFQQTNMKMDQILIVEILASKRKYINREYMTRYLERPNIDETARIKFFQSCGITESLGDFEDCFRYFFSKCCIYIPSHQAFNHALLFAALSKTMILNGNIKNKTHLKIFEEDTAFIPRLLHAMFWSTANSAHYRNLSLNPSNPQQEAIREKHGVMADIMEMFEQQPLQMDHGLEDINIPDMMQVTM